MEIQKRKGYKLSGFTLVELIVVITILTILGTIGFISMNGYFASARDSARLTDLNNMYGQLNLTQGMDGQLPLPDDTISITASGTLIAYQGYAGKTVLQTIKFEKGGKDPSDDTYYTYVVDKKKSKVQLLGFFEEYDTNKLSYTLPGSSPFIRETRASTSDYSSRIIGTIGKQLGVLVASGTLVPVQASGIGIDIVLTNTGYMAVFGNGNTISGSGNKLSALNITFTNNVQFNGYKFTTCQFSEGDVFIGTQCWKNINQSGGIISSGASAQALGTTSCYNDVSANCTSGGGLYQVSTALNGENFSENIPSGVQGICPSGYHVPSVAEYKILFSYLGYYTDNFTNPTPDITGCYSRNLLMGIGVKLADSNGFKLVSTTGQWYDSLGFGNQSQTMLLTSSDSKKGWNSFTILNTSSYPSCGAHFDQTSKDSQSKFSVRCMKN